MNGMDSFLPLRLFRLCGARVASKTFLPCRASAPIRCAAYAVRSCWQGRLRNLRFRHRCNRSEHAHRNQHLSRLSPKESNRSIRSRRKRLSINCYCRRCRRKIGSWKQSCGMSNDCRLRGAMRRRCRIRLPWQQVSNVSTLPNIRAVRAKRRRAKSRLPSNRGLLASPGPRCRWA